MYEITHGSLDEQRRQRNMLASRALLLRLRRLHYEHAPPEYKDRFLPSKIVGNPLLNIGRSSILRKDEALAAMAASAKTLTPEEEGEFIIAAVSRYYQLDPEHLLSGRKTPNLVRPRQVAMYLFQELTNLSYPTIAAALNRDHTTVIHGAKMIEKRMKTDPALQVQVEILKMQLSQLKRSQDAKFRDKRRDYYRTPWPEQRIQRLLDLRHQGLTYREISQEMGGVSARLCQAKYREIMGAV